MWELCPWSISFEPRFCSGFKEAIQLSCLKVNLPPVGSSANLFPWICWGLWLNRNLLKFENRQNTPPDILSKAIAFLREWETAHTALDQRPRIKPPQVPIQLSAPSIITCNTDAAWNKDSGEAGLAWIFKDQSGAEVSRGCQHQLHVSSPLMAEALAIRAALGHAVSLNINTIWLRSDCKGLVQSITVNQRSVELYGVLSDIESIVASSFSFFYVSFVSRSVNGPADAWAKNSLCTKLSVMGSGPH